MTARSHGDQKAQSSLVRSLVETRGDPAKRRIRNWLSTIDNEQLLGLGLTPADIALLCGDARQGPGAHEATMDSSRPCQPKEILPYQQLLVEAAAEAQLLLAGYMQPGGHDSETTLEKLIAVLNRDEIVRAIRRMKNRGGQARDDNRKIGIR